MTGPYVGRLLRSGQKMNEAVITVPAFFNQAERRSLLRSAELSGIRVLQLINDNTAGETCTRDARATHALPWHSDKYNSFLLLINIYYYQLIYCGTFIVLQV